MPSERCSIITLAKNTVHLVAEGEYGTGKPRPGRVSLDCAKAYEVCWGFFVFVFVFCFFHFLDLTYFMYRVMKCVTPLCRDFPILEHSSLGYFIRSKLESETSKLSVLIMVIL